MLHPEVVEEEEVRVGEDAHGGLGDLVAVLVTGNQRPVVVAIRKVNMLGSEGSQRPAHRPRRLEDNDFLVVVHAEAFVISVLERVFNCLHRGYRGRDGPRLRDIAVEMEGPADREEDVQRRHDHVLRVGTVLGKASQVQSVVDLAVDGNIDGQAVHEPQALRARLAVISRPD